MVISRAQEVDGGEGEGAREERAGPEGESPQAKAASSQHAEANPKRSAAHEVSDSESPGEDHEEHEKMMSFSLLFANKHTNTVWEALCYLAAVGYSFSVASSLAISHIFPSLLRRSPSHAYP